MITAPTRNTNISYEAMTPLQRGIYLTWLAGGRIQPPQHVCYPALWLFGLERRVLVDRLDLGICIGEAFRLMPLLRWESLKDSLVRFVTWMAVKLWLPEEDLLAFCKTLAVVPDELPATSWSTASTASSSSAVV